MEFIWDLTLVIWYFFLLRALVPLWLFWFTKIVSQKPAYHNSVDFSDANDAILRYNPGQHAEWNKSSRYPV